MTIAESIAEATDDRASTTRDNSAVANTASSEDRLHPAAPWTRLIDLALLLTTFLLIFTEAKIFHFHLIFILLTIGAFYWRLNAFIWRASVAVITTTALVAIFIAAQQIQFEELIEIPMLTTILLFVFTIARQRTKAEDALREANEALEKRVLARTAELSQEIAGHRKTEQILSESEERYRHLIRLSFEAITIHTNDEIIYLNPAGMKLLGVKNTEELFHRSLLDFVHPDYHEPIAARLQQVQQARKGAPLSEEKFIDLNGNMINVETATIPILYHGQTAMQTVIRDITLRKQEEQARLDERTSLARDLHDSLGQSLGYLHLKLDEIADRTSLQAVSGLAGEVAALRDVANSAYEQVRGLLAALLPANTLQLVQALHDKAKMISQQTPFHVQVISRGEENTLPAVLQQQILSLCGEALTNVAKHASAEQVKIDLCWHDHCLTITIEDDGVGFDPGVTPSNKSFGLRIMQECTAQIGGQLSIQSQIQIGTKLILQVPLYGI